MNVIPETCRAH